MVNEYTKSKPGLNALEVSGEDDDNPAKLQLAARQLPWSDPGCVAATSANVLPKHTSKYVSQVFTQKSVTQSPPKTE
jgi:hypothetical protein